MERLVPTMHVRLPGGHSRLRDACLWAHTACKMHTHAHTVYVMYTRCTVHTHVCTHGHTVCMQCAHTGSICNAHAAQCTHMHSHTDTSTNKRHMHTQHMRCTEHNMHTHVMYTPQTCTHMGVGVRVHTCTRGHTLRCCLPVTAKESVLQQNHVRQPAPVFREQPGLTLLLRPVRRPGREHRLNCSSEHTAILASTVPSTRECLGKAPAPPEPVWRAVRAHAGRGGQPARSPLPCH